MKCCMCQCVVTQAEADEADSLVRGRGFDTLCPECAAGLENFDPIGTDTFDVPDLSED